MWYFWDIYQIRCGRLEYCACQWPQTSDSEFRWIKPHPPGIQRNNACARSWRSDRVSHLFLQPSPLKRDSQQSARILTHPSLFYTMSESFVPLLILHLIIGVSYQGSHDVDKKKPRVIQLRSLLDLYSSHESLEAASPYK